VLAPSGPTAFLPSFDCSKKLLPIHKALLYLMYGLATCFVYEDNGATLEPLSAGFVLPKKLADKFPPSHSSLPFIRLDLVVLEQFLFLMGADGITWLNFY